MVRLSECAASLLALSLLVGCGPRPGGESVEAGGVVGQLRVELVVFAAASLTESFGELGRSFEQLNPGTRVIYSFAGSSLLRAQLEHGAPADVFASADLANAERARAQGLIEEGSVFARNRLVLVVPTGNPGRVETLADLARPGLRVALAAPDVPAGAYAAELLRRASVIPGFGSDFAARVQANVVSRDSDVKQALAKVRLGEVDAGIVYATDALSGAPTGQWSVRAIAIPEEVGVEAEYPIAVTKRSRNQELARAFIAHVLSPAGQAILRRAGFAAL